MGGVGVNEIALDISMGGVVYKLLDTIRLGNTEGPGVETGDLKGTGVEAGNVETCANKCS